MVATNLKNVYLSGKLLIKSLNIMIEFYFFNAIPYTTDWIDSLVGIGNLIVGSFTLWFAVKISKRFSVKQKIIDKQLDVVISLIKNIKDQTIDVRYNKDQKFGGSTSFRLQHICRANFKEKHPICFSKAKTTYFDSEFFENLKFLSYLGDELLPQSIVDSLQNIQPYGWTSIESSTVTTNDNYMLLISDNTPRYDFGLFLVPPNNSTFKTFDDFLQEVKKLMIVINNWLDSVDASEIKFRWDQELN
jgi:hypothetical protein